MGRITEASEEAEVEDAPGEVCSVRMVLPWAMQVLRHGQCWPYRSTSHLLEELRGC